MKFLFLAALLAAPALADTTIKPPRYTLIERQMPNGEKWFLKMDTETGRSWRLIQRNNDVVWVEIREVKEPPVPRQSAQSLERRLTVETSTQTR
jgi:hypothetical protein